MNPSQKSLSILTQNCFLPALFTKPARMKRLSNFVRKKGFDMVCLQEVLFQRDVKSFRDTYVPYMVKGRIGPKGGLVVLSKRKPHSVQFYKFKDQGKIISR